MSNSFNYKNGIGVGKLAFTLAEVLITLGIIGIIAEMTIPTLMNNVQNQQLMVQLKKNYTEFNQALMMFANDNGCPGDLECTGYFGATASTQAFGDAFVKYLNVSKNCQMVNNQGCMSNAYSSGYDGSIPRANMDANDYYRIFWLTDLLWNSTPTQFVKTRGITRCRNCAAKFILMSMGRIKNQTIWGATFGVFG